MTKIELNAATRSRKPIRMEAYSFKPRARTFDGTLVGHSFSANGLLSLQNNNQAGGENSFSVIRSTRVILVYSRLNVELVLCL